MKKTTLIAVTLGIAVSSMAVARADTSWNITLNGQALAKGPYGNQVGCGPEGDHFRILVGGGTGDYAKIYNTTPPQVKQVSIVDATGETYSYLSPTEPVPITNVLGGDAQVASSGNTYRITGHISPYLLPGMGGRVSNPTPVPFEFDATCP
jgi:hypothetical protein